MPDDLAQKPKYSALARKSLARTWKILFDPFSAKKWSTLILVAFLAGALGTSFNLNLRGNGAKSERLAARVERSISQKTSPKAPDKDEATKKKLASAIAKRAKEQRNPLAESVFNPSPSQYEQPPAWWVGLVVWPILIGIVLAVLALFLFFSWLSARMKMVWLYAVSKDDARLGRAWRESAEPGDRLFMPLFVLGSAFFLYFVAIVGASLYLITLSGGFLPWFPWSWRVGLGLFGAPLGLFLVSTAAALVVFSVIDDFVVPIMATDLVTFGRAWRRWVEIYVSRRPAVWKYFLFKFLFWVVGGFFQAALVILVLVAFVAAGLLVFGVPYFVFVALLKLKWFFVIWAVCLGIPFAMALIFAILAAGLPTGVFFRHFSLYFFTELEPSYRLIADTAAS